MEVGNRILQNPKSYGTAQNQVHFNGIGAKLAEKMQTEFGSIVITAVGTGLVAPGIIATNPVSKEDKKTKAYAAWRQPISAVITAVTQIAVFNKIKHVLNERSGKGGILDKGKTNLNYDLSCHLTGKEALELVIFENFDEKLKNIYNEAKEDTYKNKSFDKLKLDEQIKFLKEKCEKSSVDVDFEKLEKMAEKRARRTFGFSSSRDVLNLFSSKLGIQLDDVYNPAVKAELNEFDLSRTKVVKDSFNKLFNHPDEEVKRLAHILSELLQEVETNYRGNLFEIGKKKFKNLTAIKTPEELEMVLMQKRLLEKIELAWSKVQEPEAKKDEATKSVQKNVREYCDWLKETHPEVYETLKTKNPEIENPEAFAEKLFNKASKLVKSVEEQIKNDTNKKVMQFILNQNNAQEKPDAKISLYEKMLVEGIKLEDLDENSKKLYYDAKSVVDSEVEQHLKKIYENADKESLELILGNVADQKELANRLSYIQNYIENQELKEKISKFIKEVNSNNENQGLSFTNKIKKMFRSGTQDKEKIENIKKMLKELQDMGKGENKDLSKLFEKEMGRIKFSIKDFFETHSKQYIADAKQRITQLNNKQAFYLSMATIPLACTLLNWVYPRFMEKFFPDLSNAKKLKQQGQGGR